MITGADYEQAERDLILYEEKLGWKIHAAVFCVVMSGVVAVNLALAARTDADFPWSLVLLVCWSAVLALHHRRATRWSVRDLERQRLIPRDGASRRPIRREPSGAE
jgi:hypothetical protein